MPKNDPALQLPSWPYEILKVCTNSIPFFARILIFPGYRSCYNDHAYLHDQMMLQMSMSDPHWPTTKLWIFFHDNLLPSKIRRLLHGANMTFSCHIAARHSIWTIMVIIGQKWSDSCRHLTTHQTHVRSPYRCWRMMLSHRWSFSHSQGSTSERNELIRFDINQRQFVVYCLLFSHTNQRNRVNCGKS